MSPEQSAAVARLREALEAGPTEGQWSVRHMAGIPGSITGGVERDYANGRACDQLFMVCAVQPDNGLMAGNAKLVAACGPTTIRTLLAALDEAQADAARYRWLRGQVWGCRHALGKGPAIFAFPTAKELPPLSDIMKGSVAQHLDAAIDAARAGEKP
jgi:hypothetical protein